MRTLSLTAVFVLGAIFGLVVGSAWLPARAEMKQEEIWRPYQLSQEEWLQTQLQIMGLMSSDSKRRFFFFLTKKDKAYRVEGQIHFLHAEELDRFNRPARRGICVQNIENGSQLVEATVKRCAPIVRQMFDAQKDIVWRVTAERDGRVADVARWEDGEFSWADQETR